MSRQPTPIALARRSRLPAILRAAAGASLVLAASATVGCGEQAGGAMEVWNIEPRIGGTAGEQAVRITGRNFRQDVGYTVYFGPNRATSVLIADTSTLIVTTPQHDMGPVDVVVASEAGPAFRIQQGYTFSDQAAGQLQAGPNQGPRARP